MVKNPRLSQEVGETFYEKNNNELITRIYRRRYSLRKVCISLLNIKARLSKPLYSHEQKGLKKLLISYNKEKVLITLTT